MHPTYKRMLAGLKKKVTARPPPVILSPAKGEGSRFEILRSPHKSEQSQNDGVPERLQKKKRAGSREKKWSLYILKCCDGTFYTGITTDLERRFKMHQAGKASRYTRSHGPVEMLYSEKCGDRSSALIRECEVKEWPRTKKEALVAGEEQIPKRRKRGRKAGSTVNAQRATRNVTTYSLSVARCASRDQSS